MAKFDLARRKDSFEPAGLQPFDYLYAINYYQIKDGELEATLGKFKPGDKATLHFIRNSKKMTAPVSFAKRGGATAAS